MARRRRWRPVPPEVDRQFREVEERGTAAEVRLLRSYEDEHGEIEPAPPDAHRDSGRSLRYKLSVVKRELIARGKWPPKETG